MKTCFICLIQDIPDSSPRVPAYHDDCLFCKYCNKPVGVDLAIKEDERESRANGPDRDYSLHISHAPCFSEAMDREMQKRPITITQGLLNHINQRLAMTGCRATTSGLESLLDISLSVELNQQVGEIAVHQVINTMSPDEKFLLSKVLQNTAVTCSLLIQKDARVREVQTEIKQRDRKAYEQVLKQRENAGKEQQQKAVESQEKAIKQINREAERQDPTGMLAARRKAIESMVKAVPGMTIEMATQIVQAQSGTVKP